MPATEGRPAGSRKRLLGAGGWEIRRPPSPRRHEPWRAAAQVVVHHALLEVAGVSAGLPPVAVAAPQSTGLRLHMRWRSRTGCGERPGRGPGAYFSELSGGVGPWCCDRCGSRVGHGCGRRGCWFGLRCSIFGMAGRCCLEIWSIYTLRRSRRCHLIRINFKQQGRSIQNDDTESARAYDMVALKYWGATTTTNFPVSNYEKSRRSWRR